MVVVEKITEMEQVEKIEEVLKQIAEIDGKITKISHDMFDVNKECDCKQLNLEQEQITLKHEYEEQGVKPTQAKEKAKLDTKQQQIELMAKQARREVLKIDLDHLKRRQKHAYKLLEIMIMCFEETGGCKCSG